MSRKLTLTSILVAAAVAACGGASKQSTMPRGQGMRATTPAATVRGRISWSKGKRLTHVVAMARIKGQKPPRPIRVIVRDDGSYELPIYLGYTWTIVYETDGRKVGVASFPNRGGRPSSSFTLTDRTQIVNQYFDLGVCEPGDSYWCVVEHSPWEYYDTDGDGQTDWLDDDDDNDGTFDAEDLDDDGDGSDDAAEDFDLDDDGELDFFDDDDDGDGIADAQDQDDDGDGVDDAQDQDDDGGDADDDGVADEFDNDDDGDGVADAQDNDDDGDGVADTQDNNDDGGGFYGSQEPDDAAGDIEDGAHGQGGDPGGDDHDESRSDGEQPGDHDD